MKSQLGHIQVNIDLTNFQFYKDLMKFLNFKTVTEMDEVIGYKDASGASIWFMKGSKEGTSDYDMKGVNHVAFYVDAIESVNASTEFLNRNSIKPLFDTPRHRPEFSQSENETYYQVIFESPDKFQFEIVYIGSK